MHIIYTCVCTCTCNIYSMHGLTYPYIYVCVCVCWNLPAMDMLARRYTYVLPDIYTHTHTHFNAI